jgi:hypothetical protein
MSMMPTRRLIFHTTLVPFLLLSSLLVACGSSGGDSPGNNVTGILAKITVDTGTVTTKDGALPSAGSSPAPTVVGGTTVINGGTAQVTISADQNFTSVIVGVTGVDGYYVITLPTAVQTVDLLLTLAQALDQGSIELTYAVGTGATVGAYKDVAAAVVSVGTGDLQVSVSWDVDSDVDLHVVDPDGNDVYYGAPSQPSGGMLDLDSNAGCDIDHVRNENITWATAPRGTYTVRVDYFESCSVAATNYVVTVQRKGQAAQTFMGQLTGDGDDGGAGDGMDITTITIP